MPCRLLLAGTLVLVALTVVMSGRVGPPAQAASPFWTGSHHRTVVILADFPGYEGAAQTPARDHPIKDKLINTTANGYANNLQDFYWEISYHRLRLTVEFAPYAPGSLRGWHRIPHPKGNYSKSDVTESIQLLRDAIKAADPVVEFSRYDSVLVVISKEAKSIGCGFARGTRFGAEDKTKSKLNAETGDGVTINRAAQVCEDSSVATIAHEFGHILGLPDLYASDPTRRFMGGWDLMAASSGFACASSSLVGLGGWSRMKLGFVPAAAVETVEGGETRSVALDPLDALRLSTGSRRLIRFNNPLDPRKYLMVEVRRPQGYDANLPGTGVLISEADEALGDGEGTVRVVPALRESFATPMDGALFKAPGERSANPRCDTSPGLSRWSGRYDATVAGVGARRWFPEISITERRGSTYTVQVSGRVSR